jgi:hypothetical protein
MRTLALSISSELDYLDIWHGSTYIAEENIYDKGYVCGTSLDNGPGVTVKIARDLALKGHNIFLILVGCNDRELQQNNDASINAKKLRGLAAGWRKCNCKKLIEIPREILFSNDNKISVLNFELERMRKCEQLLLLYEELEKSKKSSHDNGKVGALLFFPTIPGSGKSALCGYFEQERNCNDSFQKLKDREVIVRESDSTKGKYYPIVKREKCFNPSSIYVSSICLKLLLR